MELLFDDEVPCKHHPDPLIPGRRVVWHVSIPFFIYPKWANLKPMAPYIHAHGLIQPLVDFFIKVRRRCRPANAPSTLRVHLSLGFVTIGILWHCKSQRLYPWEVNLLYFVLRRQGPSPQGLMQPAKTEMRCAAFVYTYKATHLSIYKI